MSGKPSDQIFGERRGRQLSRFPATTYTSPMFPPGVLPAQLARSPALQKMFNLPVPKPSRPKRPALSSSPAGGTKNALQTAAPSLVSPAKSIYTSSTPILPSDFSSQAAPTDS